MKTTIACLAILLVLDLQAQKNVNVTIIGTAHYFQPEYQHLQSFDEVKSFINQLDPDIVCIEAIPVEDTLSLQEIWPNTISKADQLRDTLPQLKEQMLNQAQIEGAAHYIDYDFWNAYYSWFPLVKNDSLGYFNRYYRDQSKSEYGLMIFPAALRLGIDTLYGIDYRVDEKEFLESSNKVMKKLLLSLKWKPLRSYLKTQKQYKKAEKEGQLIEFINGDVFQNAFSNLIDDIPNALPKSDEAQFVKEYWLKRNKIMAERIIKTAKEQSAENVLLAVGSAHVTHIKRFLEKAGVQVTTYGQVLATNK